jgi:ankyrin repeat protein
MANDAAAAIPQTSARIGGDDSNVECAAVEFGMERSQDPALAAALHAAAGAGNRARVEELLALGADPNIHVDSAGNSVYAAARYPELRALLEAHGGTLDPYDLVWLDEDDEVLRRIAENPASAHDGCGGVFTAVCTRGKRELLMRLLDAGVRVPSNAGGCQSYLLEQPDMLGLLLERGGLDADYPTPEGVTLLHQLCRRDGRGRTMDRRTECATILVAAGATIDARDRDGATPLDWAVRHDIPDMIEFLRARRARSDR